MTNEVGIYFEVYGLAIDDLGNKDYAGAKIVLNTNVDNEKAKALNSLAYNNTNNEDCKKELIKKCCFRGLFTEKDINILTQQEYIDKYGDEED